MFNDTEARVLAILSGTGFVEAAEDVVLGTT